MSDKDTVSSQDIPALIRVLGTLALAAATAVAMKWFFSHDTKEEKTECNGEDLHSSPCSTIEDEETTYDGCIILDGVPRNTNSPEVSDGGENKVNLLIEGWHDCDCYKSPAEISCISQTTNSEDKNGQQIDISCDISSQTVNQITAVTCHFKEVATSPANNTLSIQIEDGYNASVPTSTTRGSATNAAKNQMFSDCLKHSVSSIQEPECSSGTSSGYGECINDLNTSCSGQYKLSDQDKPFVRDNTMSIDVSGDNLTNEPREKDGVLDCHSETNDIKHTTSPEEQKYNINNLVIDFNSENNILVTSIGTDGEKNVDAICNPFAYETRAGAGISNCHSVPLISDNTATLGSNSAFENDTLPCTEVFPHIQKASSACENHVASAGDVFEGTKQSVTLHSKIDSQNTNIYQSDGRQKLTMDYDIVIETPHEEVKLCILDKIHNIKYTTSPAEQKYNIDNLVLDFNAEDNTLITGIGIGGRKKGDVICNPFTSETEMRTSLSLISDNAAKCKINSAFENYTVPCAEAFSHVQNASSASENIVSIGDDVFEDNKQKVSLRSRKDSQDTNIYQSEGRQKLSVDHVKVSEIPKNDCILDTVHNAIDDDNDTKNMAHSLENVLPNKDSKNVQPFLPPMDVDNDRYVTQQSLQAPIIPKHETMTANAHSYPNNTNELLLSEKWEATTLDKHADHTALMESLDLEDFNVSLHFQGKQSEHQPYAEEMSDVLKHISKDSSHNVTFENSIEIIDISRESFGLYCTNTNVEHVVTTSENIMNYSTSLGTGSSTGVTGAEFISGVESISYVTDNSAFQNCYTCRDIHQEITNGYLDIDHEVTDDNNGLSNIIEKEGDDCSKDLTSLLPEPCSSLLSTAFPNADSSLASLDSNVALPAMMDIENSARKPQQNANENDYFQANVVGDTFTSCITPLAKGDPMCCDFNITSMQDQNTFLASDDTNLYSKDKDDVSHSREKIMSAIAENPELILPEYQSKRRLVKKRPLITKSCDNILSRHSFQEPNLKTKAQSMLCLLTEYYSSKLPSENGPVEEVARGSFIRIPKGLQSIGEAMRFQLTLGNCLELLKLARKNRVQELLKAVYTVISDNYLNVLKNSAVYGQLTGLERERILQLRMRGKLSLCVVETKSIFGLTKYIRSPVEATEHKTQLYMLDSEVNQWKPVTSIPEEACLKGCSICSMHNYLFIAGGLQETSDGLTCSNKLFCYNPLTDIWTQLSPMNEARSQLKLIPLDGYLYAIGGECLHTVERYDPRANKWTFVAPLPKGTFAVAHEAAACGGEIYISGGHLFYRLLKYSPVHDEWEECPFNTSKGRSCDMVAVGSILYRFDMHKDSSVNILKYNTMAKMWSEYTATFPGSKIPFKCALLEGNIYCLNRETIAKFSMNDENVVFEAGVFSNVLTKGAGSPHPIVLCLHGSVSQTSV